MQHLNFQNFAACPDCWFPEVSFTPIVTLPEGVLPPVVSEWINALADADGLDRSSLTMVFLIIAASAVPSDLRLYMHTNASRTKWTEPALLWLCLVSQSGGGKSPNINPIVELLKSVFKAFNIDRMTAYDAERNGSADPEDKPPPYVSPQIEDITPPACVRRLQKNAGTSTGLLLVDDDASGFLGGFGRFGSGTESSDQTFYVKSYEGKEYGYDRKTGGDDGGADQVLVKLHISMILGIQTRKLRQFPNLADVGMFQRMSSPRSPDCSGSSLNKSARFFTVALPVKM